MKINAITFLNKNSLKLNPIKKNLKNPYMGQPSFKGIFDTFQKQDNSEDRKTDNLIKNYLKYEAIKDDEILRKNVFVFNSNLKSFLKIGKKLNYNCYLTGDKTEKRATSVTFGEYDKNMNAPKIINFWKYGKLEAYYTIFELEPTMSYSYTTCNGDVQKEYVVEDNKMTSFFSVDKEGEMIFHFPYDNGFKRQEAIRTNENTAIIMTEMYYDYENPQQSYYKENNDEGIDEYGFDEIRNRWIYKQTIPKPEQTENK